MAEVENIIIKFDADITGMQPAIDILEKTGQVDKQTADQFRKGNEAFKQRQKAVNDAAVSQKQFTESTNASAKSVEAFAQSSKKVADSGLNKTMNEFAKQTMLGVKDALDEAGVSMDEFTTALKKNGVVTDEIGKKTQSLRSQYRELLAAADAAGGAQTKAGLKILKQAGEIKDQMGDLQASAKAFGSDTRTFDGVLQGLQGVASGFQVAMGMQALFGDQSKEFEQTLIKLNAAMAIANGLRDAQNLLQKESAFTTGVLIPLQTAWAAVTNYTAAAFGRLSTAILATGIGALVIGIGLAIVAFKEYSETVESAADKTKRLNEENQKFNDQVEEHVNKAEALDSVTNTRIRTLTREIEVMKARGEAADAIDKKEAELINIQIARLRVRRDSFDEGTRQFNDANQAVYDLQTKLLVMTAENEKRDAEAKIKANEARKLDNITTIKAITDAEITASEFVNEVKLRNTMDQEDKNLNVLRDSSERQIALIEETEQRKKEIILQSAVDNAFQISDAIFQITANKNAEETDAKLSSLEKQKDKELANKKLTEAQKAAIEAKYAAEERKIKEEAAKRQKQAAKTQAIINGALAITNILATVPGGPLSPATIAALIAAGIATVSQVAVISSQPDPKFAKGVEYLHGPGSAKSDSIRAWLSKGERVVPADVNNDYFPALSAIHNRRITPHLANSLLNNIPQLKDFDPNMLKISNDGVGIDYDKLAKALSSNLNGMDELYDINKNAQGTNALLAGILSKLGSNGNDIRRN